SRRRHTRFSRDWSSDVCSSDLLVEMRAFHRGLELDVLLEVETVGHIVQPTLDLGLSRKPLAPAPAVVELLGEQILIGVAFGIEEIGRASCRGRLSIVVVAVRSQ